MYQYIEFLVLELHFYNPHQDKHCWKISISQFQHVLHYKQHIMVSTQISHNSIYWYNTYCLLKYHTIQYIDKILTYYSNITQFNILIQYLLSTQISHNSIYWYNTYILLKYHSIQYVDTILTVYSNMTQFNILIQYLHTTQISHNSIYWYNTYSFVHINTRYT